MEPELIAAIAGGGVATLLLVLLGITRRGRTRARRRVNLLERDLADRSESLATSAAGEREAVWALGETRRLLEAERVSHTETLTRIEALERDLDDLTERLAAADSDLTTARREAEEAATEIARLETEVARLEALPDDMDDDATDSLQERLDEALASLEAERAGAEELRARLASVPTEQDDPGLRDRLVSSEARRRDLEDRLASLNSVRASEQRTAAERIAGLERLHLQIGDREERIGELEIELKHASEARDEALEEAARLEVEILALKNELKEMQDRLSLVESDAAELAAARLRITELERQIAGSSGLQAEVDRLRKSLDAERARADRIGRRVTEGSTDSTYAMWDRVVRERVEAAVARDTARLSEQVEHLRLVVAEKEERLRALTDGAADDGPREIPDVTAIKGIGRVIAGILAEHGITTVADVAALTEADIDRLGEVMPVYPGRIRDDDWVGQARSFL